MVVDPDSGAIVGSGSGFHNKMGPGFFLECLVRIQPSKFGRLLFSEEKTEARSVRSWYWSGLRFFKGWVRSPFFAGQIWIRFFSQRLVPDPEPTFKRVASWSGLFLDGRNHDPGIFLKAGSGSMYFEVWIRIRFFNLTVGYRSKYFPEGRIRVSSTRGKKSKKAWKEGEDWGKGRQKLAKMYQTCKFFWTGAKQLCGFKICPSPPKK